MEIFKCQNDLSCIKPGMWLTEAEETIIILVNHETEPLQTQTGLDIETKR